MVTLFSLGLKQSNLTFLDAVKLLLRTPNSLKQCGETFVSSVEATEVVSPPQHYCMSTRHEQPDSLSIAEYERIYITFRATAVHHTDREMLIAVKPQTVH